MNVRVTVLKREGAADFSALSALGGLLCGVGVFAHTDARPGSMGNAALLRLHEKGSPLQGIPARPVMERALSGETVEPALRRALEASLEGGALQQALAAAGETAAESVRRLFGAIGPKNSPAVIARKGADSPLVDTGALRAAISCQLRSR